MLSALLGLGAPLVAAPFYDVRDGYGLRGPHGIVTTPTFDLGWSGVLNEDEIREAKKADWWLFDPKNYTQYGQGPNYHPKESAGAYGYVIRSACKDVRSVTGAVSTENHHSLIIETHDGQCVVAHFSDQDTDGRTLISFEKNKGHESLHVQLKYQIARHINAREPQIRESLKAYRERFCKNPGFIKRWLYRQDDSQYPVYGDCSEQAEEKELTQVMVREGDYPERLGQFERQS